MIHQGASSSVARFFGTRCRCGALAVTHHKIRLYRSAGRLTPSEAGLVLPRADKPPVEPLCVHHLLPWLMNWFGHRHRTIDLPFDHGLRANVVAIDQVRIRAVLSAVPPH